MQALNEELTKFERCEREFRKKDCDERAKRLQMPVEKYDRRRLVPSKAVKSDSWTGRHLTTSLATEP
jgi:hypothetical protein